MRRHIYIFVLLTMILFNSCTSQRHFGYFEGNRYQFQISPDGSFRYSFSMHMVGDSSSGTYVISGDTIKFQYQTSAMDSVRHWARYEAGLWKGNRIYPLSNSGIVSKNNYWKYRNR